MSERHEPLPHRRLRSARLSSSRKSSDTVDINWSDGTVVKAGAETAHDRELYLPRGWCDDFLEKLTEVVQQEPVDFGRKRLIWIFFAGTSKVGSEVKPCPQSASTGRPANARGGSLHPRTCSSAMPPAAAPSPSIVVARSADVIRGPDGRQWRNVSEGTLTVIASSIAV